MRGFRLGSVLGLEVRIDYSWFIIFFLILWTFSAGVFPAALPGHSPGIYLLMGGIGALLFFASLLAHELTHSVVARSKGIPVEGITLFVFGGMARTRMEAASPGDEFVIAGVGPLASVVIALLFGLVAWIGAAAGLSAVAGVAQYLAFLNLALAVFNLLPGFPLDGGRLFRAAAWRFTGDLTKATRWATTGGRWLGYMLMAVGVLEVFAGGLMGGIWLVFIGWFVRTAAGASFAQHLLRESLEGIRASEVMIEEPESVPPDITIESFVEDHILKGRHRAYPVVEGGHPIGLVTLDQVRADPRDAWPRHRVRDVMAPVGEEITVSPDETMMHVLEKLASDRNGRVLVTRDGRLVGIITRADLARWAERMQLLREVGAKS